MSPLPARRPGTCRLLGSLAGALLLAACARGEGAPTQELPDGISSRMIVRGDSVYHGPGFCYTCHGPDGRGVPQLGADLTDEEWLHGDGSYEGIVQRVRAGVSSEESTSGVPMPPRGGAKLSEEQVREVAAYVWSLSHGGG